MCIANSRSVIDTEAQALTQIEAQAQAQADSEAQAGTGTGRQMGTFREIRFSFPVHRTIEHVLSKPLGHR